MKTLSILAVPGAAFAAADDLRAFIPSQTWWWHGTADVAARWRSW
jgi:hypothetical protein